MCGRNCRLLNLTNLHKTRCKFTKFLLLLQTAGNKLGRNHVEEFDKKYYKISEVAEIIGLPPSTLRFWEKEFTVIHPKRNASGIRFYTPSDIEKIRMIAFLVKEKGLRLEAAQEQIRHNHSGVSRRSQAITRLHEIRDRLQTLLDSLHSLR